MPSPNAFISSNGAVKTVLAVPFRVARSRRALTRPCTDRAVPRSAESIGVIAVLKPRRAAQEGSAVPLNRATLVKCEMSSTLTRSLPNTPDRAIRPWWWQSSVHSDARQAWACPGISHAARRRHSLVRRIASANADRLTSPCWRRGRFKLTAAANFPAARRRTRIRPDDASLTALRGRSRHVAKPRSG